MKPTKEQCIDRAARAYIEVLREMRQAGIAIPSRT